MGGEETETCNKDTLPRQVKARHTPLLQHSEINIYKGGVGTSMLAPPKHDYQLDTADGHMTM